MAKGRRFYVTTPIYYVNDSPHIGHSYTTILGDVLARYHRLFGEEVRFMTGTDEHGQKVQQAAQKSGKTPIEHCDLYSERFKEMWRLLEIRYDRFIRTTEPAHEKTVSEILQKLYDQGDIYRDTYSGWYNVSEEMFISDDEVTEEGKETGRIVHVSEDNYFFRLSKYQDWLIEHIEKNPEFIHPESRKNEVLGLLREPVADLCISRPKSRLEWGIELPFDEDYVTYVWFDALVNYVSGLEWPDSKLFKTWWDTKDSHVLHLIGKDILKPHGFFWPIMLHAAGIPLPDQLLAHGWWTRGGLKESKTVTKELAAQAPVRHIRELVEEYGVDPIRYYLLREMTLGRDQDYSEEMIVTRLNSDLANDLGNLVNRVTKLIKQNFGSKIPPLTDPEFGEELREKAETLPDDVEKLIDELKPNLATEEIIALVRHTNGFIAAHEPWKQAKIGNLEGAGNCLAVAIRVLRQVGILLYPVMPLKSLALLEQIGCPLNESQMVRDSLDWNLPAEGTELPEGEPLFPRINWKDIEKKIVAAIPTTSKPEKEKAEDDESGLITIDDFFKTELRVAEVIRADKVLDADKLLKLQIKVGEEQRQIVAGVAEFYSPEEMIGKKIVVVANLKPAKIRGIESNGMLLAAKKGKKLRLVTVEGDEIGAGAKVG
ncbi:MAG: methionine--tRNA ligase [Candidatus Omnitrophica bacterium]|nr:methionine--tRNA ligase [Candidatus Omnitrophota bacterium]